MLVIFFHFWQIEVILRHLKCKQLFMLPYFSLKRAFGKFTPSPLRQAPFTFSNPWIIMFLEVKLAKVHNKTDIHMCNTKSTPRHEQQRQQFLHPLICHWDVFAELKIYVRFETFNCRFANLLGVWMGSRRRCLQTTKPKAYYVIGTVAKADNFFDIKNFIKEILLAVASMFS